jgi:UDP-glucose 4-epimerase
MSKIIITGASGFIGRHLHSHLIASRADVIAVSRKHLEGLKQVTDYAHSPDGDVLFHLGEEPDRALVNKAGIAYLEASVRVVGMLAKRGFPRLIYISSGAVYGDERLQPSKPGDTVIANDIYNRAKLINENMVLEAGGVVVRLGNIYGKGMSAGNVLSDIIAQIPMRGHLEVRDATSVRDYLHVDDLVEALKLLALSDYTGVVNIASGIGSSVRRLAEISLSAVGQANRKIVSTNLVRGSSSINILDISETNIILGWRPRISLVDGVNSLLINKLESNHEN